MGPAAGILNGAKRRNKTKKRIWRTDTITKGEKVTGKSFENAYAF